MRKGTLTTSTLIFISAAFGASVLAIPWAMGQCGWALAIAVLVGSAALVQVGIERYGRDLISTATALTAETQRQAEGGNEHQAGATRGREGLRLRVLVVCVRA